MLLPGMGQRTRTWICYTNGRVVSVALGRLVREVGPAYFWNLRFFSLLQGELSVSVSGVDMMDWMRIYLKN